MSKIEGKAKRYDGTPVDYVLIFDWLTGSFISKRVPDAAGNWSYDYFADLDCGITYVANGCEPITHGAYQFVFTPEALTGFLLLSYSSSGGKYNSTLDVNATSQPTWDEYFSQTKDFALIDYAHGAGAPVETAWRTKVIDRFELDWVFLLAGDNLSWGQDSLKWTFEILDASNNVLFALRCETYGQLKMGLWYGKSITSGVEASTTGTYPQVGGELSFTTSGVTYKNTRSTNHNNSFVFNVDLTTAAKVRVGGIARALRPAPGSDAGGYIRILPPK